MRVPEQVRCWLEIDLAALERNLAVIRRSIPQPLQYWSVVKANAYGLGSTALVTRLMRAGVDGFCVANVEEAAQVRALGEGWPILVLGPLLPAEYPLALDLEVMPTLSSPTEVEAWAALASKRAGPVPVQVKIDTGMGRMGVWHEEVAAIASALRAHPVLALKGLWTHFALADRDPAFTQLQRQRFHRALKAFAPLPAGVALHADNSAGLASVEGGAALTAIRVGLLQLGYAPAPAARPVPVTPVCTWRARIGLIKRVPAGCGLSYGHTYRTRRAMTLAVVTAGYADGLSVQLSNNGSVLVRGQRCPLVGRITMDQCLVDVSAVPEAAVGDPVTFHGVDRGAALPLEDFARGSGQLVWEALVAPTARVARYYRRDTAV